MNVDTLGTGDDDFRVTFSYPRLPGNPSRIIVGLSDVRAANAIVISYDFDRDGYSIQSDLDRPAHEECMVTRCAHQRKGALTEVAFIPAWVGESDESE